MRCGRAWRPSRRPPVRGGRAARRAGRGRWRWLGQTSGAFVKAGRPARWRSWFSSPPARTMSIRNPGTGSPGTQPAPGAPPAGGPKTPTHPTTPPPHPHRHDHGCARRARGADAEVGAGHDHVARAHLAREFGADALQAVPGDGVGAVLHRVAGRERVGVDVDAQAPDAVAAGGIHASTSRGSVTWPRSAAAATVYGEPR